MKMKSFSELYEIEKVFSGELEKKLCWKDTNHPKCRFCDEAKVNNFGSDAHVIPEALGNRYLLSNYECNHCNKKIFNDYDNNLCNFLDPIRTISLTEGKPRKRTGKTSRIPKFKNPKTGRTIEGNLNSLELIKREIPQELIDRIMGKPGVHLGKELGGISHDEKVKKLKLQLETKKYVPIKVFKALLKIGFSFVNNNEKGNFKAVKKFLKPEKSIAPLNNNIRNNNFIIMNLFVNSELTTKEQPKGILFRKKNIETDFFLIEKVFVLYYSCYILQIPILFSDKDLTAIRTKKINFRLPIVDKDFLTYFSKGQLIKTISKQQIDMSSLEKRKHEIQMKFEPYSWAIKVKK